MGIVDVAQWVKNALEKEGIVADTQSVTDDKSLLLSFFKNASGCVDIYPDGEIVVIIGRNGKKELYEFGLDEFRDVIRLLTDGGFGK